MSDVQRELTIADLHSLDTSTTEASPTDSDDNICFINVRRRRSALVSTFGWVINLTIHSASTDVDYTIRFYDGDMRNDIGLPSGTASEITAFRNKRLILELKTNSNDTYPENYSAYVGVRSDDLTDPRKVGRFIWMTVEASAANATPIKISAELGTERRTFDSVSTQRAAHGGGGPTGSTTTGSDWSDYAHSGPVKKS